MSLFFSFLFLYPIFKWGHQSHFSYTVTQHKHIDYRKEIYIYTKVEQSLLQCFTNYKPESRFVNATSLGAGTHVLTSNSDSLCYKCKMCQVIFIQLQEISIIKQHYTECWIDFKYILIFIWQCFISLWKI